MATPPKIDTRMLVLASSGQGFLQKKVPVRRQSGSNMVAARQSHREMLAFAAHHSIRPIIKQFPMAVEGTTESMKKLDDGKMRYRGVVVAQ
jgi:D-arabinose 1-dehydrogenase-like Zn-dependent alcohol dehydrogenase